MPITYPLSLPSTPTFRSIDFRPVEAVGQGRSRFTLQRQVQRHQGQLWVAELDLPPMPRAEAEAWVAFLLSLKGIYGTFLLGDPVGATPRGTATGTPVADSAGSPTVNQIRDEEIYIRGCTAGVTGWLKAGDWLQVGSGSTARLHKNLQDVDSDGTGRAVCHVWPRLRASLADGEAITLNSAKGVFSLARNQMAWSIGEAQIYGIGFSAVEALGNE